MKTNRKITRYQNLDGKDFYNPDTGKFLMNFDDAQMELLSYGLEKNMPVQAIAYTNITAECMKAAIEYMIENQGDRALLGLKRVDYWKTVMIFKDPDECRMVLAAAKHYVNIFEEFDDVRKLDRQTLEIIAEAADSYNINLCKQVKKGLTGQALVAYAEKKVIKNEKTARRNNFFYLLRHPKAKKTGLFG